MSDTPKDWLDRVYQSRTLDELEESYDGWAEDKAVSVTDGTVVRIDTDAGVAPDEGLLGEAVAVHG